MRAVDTLEAVVWSALRAELRDDDPELVAQLAERLSRIAGLVRAATLRGIGSSGPPSTHGTHLRPLPNPGPAPSGRAGRPVVADRPPMTENPSPTTIDESVWVGCSIAS